MIAPGQYRAKRERETAGASHRSPDLPFRIELWDKENSKLKRVVARAHNVTLAQAIFNAACQEYPDGHLTLWQGRERLADKKV